MSHCLSDGKIQEMHWRPSSQSASVCLGGIPVGEKGGGAVKVWGDQSDVDIYMCILSILSPLLAKVQTCAFRKHIDTHVTS